jgi:hypothetical protein
MLKQIPVCWAMVCLFVAAAPKANAQDAVANATAQPTTPSAPAQQTAPKVWTNDDLGKPATMAPRKVASNSHPAKTATTAKKPAVNYQAQIQKLQAQLPPIDSQIAELQDAISGKGTSEARKYVGVRPDSWPAELDALQKKRADIQSQIDALEDQARHAGVQASTLP